MQVHVHNSISAAQPVKLEETPLDPRGVVLKIGGRLACVALDAVGRQHKHVHLLTGLDRMLQPRVGASRQDILQPIVADSDRERQVPVHTALAEDCFSRRREQRRFCMTAVASRAGQKGNGA
jgi:hypothetical protein